MSFANLPLFGVLLGLLALAGALFLLQQLRSRFREITLPTTMFWASAAREAPVRVFRERFRHPLAYLLLLLIVSLLWLGFAEPTVSEGEDGQYRVLFLDASAHTSNSADFEEAVRALKADLALMPEGTREVVWGGAHILRLLGPGESPVLLDARLEDWLPEASPSPIEDQIRLLQMPGAYPDSLELVIYGRAQPSPSSITNSGVQVSYGTEYSDQPENLGIVALGVVEAASGQWEMLDLLIRVGTPSEDEPAMDASLLEVSLDGEPMAGELLEPLAEGAFQIRDVPASGGVIEVRINREDHLALDNLARLRLPERHLIRVAIAPELAEAFEDVIYADAGLHLAQTDLAQADVVIRDAESDFGGSLPALELIPMSEGSSAFELGAPITGDAQATLSRSLASLGLDQIDGQGLAQSIARPIEVRLFENEVRSLRIWAELIEPSFNLKGSRSFPLLVSRSLRWLTNSEPWFYYLAAGRALADRSRDHGLAASGDPGWQILGSALVPPRAGQLRLGPEGREYWVSLLDASLSEPGGEGETRMFDLAGSSAVTSSGLMTLLILLAVLLLAAEWYLYRRGLIP